MVELPLQPGGGCRLTLAGETRKHNHPFVIALCECGQLMSIQRSLWTNGLIRPRTCTHCARNKRRYFNYRSTPSEPTRAFAPRPRGR